MYFDLVFDKIYSYYQICEEYKRKYKYLTKDRFKEAIHNSYYNYLKYGNYDYDKILDSVNNIFIEENRYEDSFIPLDTINGYYIPKNVEDAIIYLNNTIDSNSIAEFKNLAEETAVSIEHIGIGMWMRNKFRLWGKSRLQQYFEKYKIRHPDHMSSIILTAWHRSLNNKEIKLNLIMSALRKYEEKYED